MIGAKVSIATSVSAGLNSENALPPYSAKTSALDLLLYVVIAKSCFLLSRKEAIETAIATGIIWQICRIWDMDEQIEWMASIVPDVFADPQRYIVYTFLKIFTSATTRQIFHIQFAFYITLNFAA